jgi:hypothetical protein
MEEREDGGKGIGGKEIGRKGGWRKMRREREI